MFELIILEFSKSWSFNYFEEYIYVTMEVITNRVLHFYYRKVGFYFRNRKLLNYRMEENSSVGILAIFKL